jgi:hypothetical protein
MTDLWDSKRYYAIISFNSNECRMYYTFQYFITALVIISLWYVCHSNRGLNYCNVWAINIFLVWEKNIFKAKKKTRFERSFIWEVALVLVISIVSEVFCYNCRAIEKMENYKRIPFHESIWAPKVTLRCTLYIVLLWKALEAFGPVVRQ